MTKLAKNTTSTAQAYDAIIEEIADYVMDYNTPSQLALDTAERAIFDSLACAVRALQDGACQNLLGPRFDHQIVSSGCLPLGSPNLMEPIEGTFHMSCLIRWLDYNDTWLAREWGHPSDNLGAIFMLMDYLNREHKNRFSISDAIHAAIKAYEIQGILALDNSFNEIGLDHVILVKIASSAIAAMILGGDRDAICRTISNAWIDGHPLRIYRHQPNTGPRKSWAAADASARAVHLAWQCVKRGDMGYPTALSEKKWGFEAVYMKNNPITLARPLGCYVMENILFKIQYPAEFHGQTAVEAAIKLHPEVKDKLSQIKTINLETQAPAMKIINKKGPLTNPADRDHCIQYMVAVALITGKLSVESYHDDFHLAEPLIDKIREKISVTENILFTESYYDPAKRHIPNAIQITYKDDSKSHRICIEAPIGHRERRDEGLPLLHEKISNIFSGYYASQKARRIFRFYLDSRELLFLPIHELFNLLSGKS